MLHCWDSPTLNFHRFMLVGMDVRESEVGIDLDLILELELKLVLARSEVKR